MGLGVGKHTTKLYFREKIVFERGSSLSLRLDLWAPSMGP